MSKTFRLNGVRRYLRTGLKVDRERKRIRAERREIRNPGTRAPYKPQPKPFKSVFGKMMDIAKKLSFRGQDK